MQKLRLLLALLSLTPGIVFGQSNQDIGKLNIRGTNTHLTWFVNLYSECSKKYNLIDEIQKEIDSSNGIYLVIRPHTNVVIAGEARDLILTTSHYFLDPNQVMKFPSPNNLAQTGQVAPPAWATDQCMILVHELREVLVWSRGQTDHHSQGIISENQIRHAKNQPERESNVSVDHGNHLDYLIPIGENIERLHSQPGQKAISYITYLEPL